MRKVSSIVGLPVIASADGVNMGTVTEVVVDLSKGAIMGMVVGTQPAEKAVMAEEIAVIGPDAIMIGDRSKMLPIGEVPDLSAKRRAASDKPIVVMTKSGTRLGTLAEVHVDTTTHQVIQYDVSGGPVRDLTDGTLALPVVDNVVHGPDTVIIPDALITSLEEQVGGLRGTWASVSKTLRKDLHRASEKATVLYQRSSEGVKEAVEQARQKSEQVSKTVAEKLEQPRKSKQEPTASEQPPDDSEPGTDAQESSSESAQPPNEQNEGGENHQEQKPGQ